MMKMLYFIVQSKINLQVLEFELEVKANAITIMKHNKELWISISDLSNYLNQS